MWLWYIWEPLMTQYLVLSNKSYPKNSCKIDNYILSLWFTLGSVNENKLIQARKSMHSSLILLQNTNGFWVNATFLLEHPNSVDYYVQQTIALNLYNKVAQHSILGKAMTNSKWKKQNNTVLFIGIVITSLLGITVVLLRGQLGQQQDLVAQVVGFTLTVGCIPLSFVLAHYYPQPNEPHAKSWAWNYAITHHQSTCG